MKAAVDDEILDRARAGDTAAFGVLVETYSQDVFRLAFRITRNEQDAEDAVQETFLRAYRRLEAFEARSNFGTWLYRVTANTAIDVLRRSRRNERRSAPLDVELAGVEGAQERTVFSRQIRERLETALDGLSELERTAFALRHFEGLPVAEVSASLDITTSATKQAIFRAVRKLRKALAPMARTVT